MIRDTWRAVLVVVVAVLLREVFAGRPAPPAVATQWVPPAVASQWVPQHPVANQWVQQPPATAQPERPLRRVGGAVLELAESVIGVVR